MRFIEDSRQKAEKHELKHEYFEKNGHVFERCKLLVGDYALAPKVSVDTKENMLEIAGNICGTTKEHIRFKNECILARDYGTQLIILVENEDGITCVEDVAKWQNPRRFVSPKAVDGSRLAKAMQTMSERYGVKFMFCRPEEAGEIIIKLLEKDYEYK